jgi:hypothetical protein
MILGDSQDKRCTQILQNLGSLPHQGSPPTGLGDAVRLDALMKPPKLNELHQLEAAVPGLIPHACAYASFDVHSSRSRSH